MSTGRRWTGLAPGCAPSILLCDTTAPFVRQSARSSVLLPRWDNVRHSDCALQGKDYDPEGRYIRKWVPELSGVPPEHIHQPWRMTAEQQAACRVRLPEHYPLPIDGTRYTEAG